MEGTRKRPEILSPAGSMESLQAAVMAGCDAVYMGGSRFGARAFAQNPDRDGMLEAVRYCHRYGKKLYLTVNTILKETELYGELYEYIRPYYEIGADAVIVQDVGVMRFLHREFPDLPLHASTQMTLTMGVNDTLLKPYGVTRMVPARELSLQELAKMRKQTELELEVFVHGALCYCYSGQCLFSSMLGGRSGNRGRCAQPCRMVYERMNRECRSGQYYLSPKENNNLQYIGELIESGIDSFKIEGRMKRPEYTAYTTYIYRKYTDYYMQFGREGCREYLQEHQEEWQEDLRRLGELYNREGFTSGYLEGASGVPLQSRKDGAGMMLSLHRPKHGGIRVGQVVGVDRQQVTYMTELALHAHDVVEFRNTSGQPVYEYTLGEDKKAGSNVSSRYLKGSLIKKGDSVYRTKDAFLLEQIRRELLQCRRIAVEAEFFAREGQPMRLKLCCRDSGCVITAEGDICEAAKKQPADEDSVRRCLQQTGETPFVMEKCKVSLSGALFLPVAAVKKLRRKGLQQLQEALELRGCREHQKVLKRQEFLSDYGPAETESKGKGNRSPRRKAMVSTWEQLEAVLRFGRMEVIYLNQEYFEESSLDRALESITAAGKEAGLAMPRIFRYPLYQKALAELAKKGSVYRHRRITQYLIRNMESFIFLTEEAHVPAARIIPDSQMYTANSEAFAYWYEQGCRSTTLPLELTGAEWSRLNSRHAMEAICYGHIPLMVSAQCLWHNTKGCAKQEKARPEILRDVRGREFLVSKVCRYCYNLIYRKEPLNLLAELDEIEKMGVGALRFEFTLESGEETRRILQGITEQGWKGHYYKGIE